MIICSDYFGRLVYGGIWERISAPDKRGKRDSFGIISHIFFFYENMFCDPSFEPSHIDGSNEGSQQMLSLRNREKNL